MYIKMSFFDVLNEVQKDPQDVSTGKYIFFQSTQEVFLQFDVKVSKVNFDLAQ